MHSCVDERRGARLINWRQVERRCSEFVFHAKEGSARERGDKLIVGLGEVGGSRGDPYANVMQNVANGGCARDKNSMPGPIHRAPII